MNWPSIIKTLREKMFLSQSKFGSLLGVSYVTVSRWEGGQCSPHFSKRAKIIELCREHDVKLKEFIFIRKQ